VTAVPADDHPLITAARAWYDAGYAVVPSHEDGTKRPWGRWKSYQSERMGWDDLQALLLTDRHTGIGAIMGKASDNTELIEIEGPADLAMAALEKLRVAAVDHDCTDLLERIFRGCMIRSAGDGLHLFIRITDGTAKANTKLAMSAAGEVVAETRGEGGFVIVAPTPGRKGHAEGKVYAFIGPSNPAATALVTADERDQLHELFRIALDETPATTPAVTPRVMEPYAGTSSLDAFRATSWAAILTPLGWTYDHRDDTRDYWVRPGKSAADGISASTIEDGPMVCFSTNAGLPTDVGMSKGQVYAHLHHGGDMSAASRALSDQGFGDRVALPPLPAWEVNIGADMSPDEAASSWVADNLPRVDWHDLWQQEQKEEWIVEPLLAARRLVALYSAPKVGKSLLMLEIAAAVANGKAMLGYQAPSRAYRTLYVDFENDPRADVRERLESMGYGPDDLDNLVMLSFPTMNYLDTEAGSLELLAAIRYYGCEIVVVDTVSRAIGGEENENDTWLKFYKHTGLKLKQEGVALIRLDHAGKDESKGQRGGSAKSGDVDAVWRMSKDGDDTFRLQCEAQRFPISETDLTLRRIEDGSGLRHEVVGNPAKDRHERVLDALRKHRIDKDLSLTAATKAVRKAGAVIGKGRIPEATWAAYCAEIPGWDHSQEAL
jgi:hypothetical protein